MSITESTGNVFRDMGIDPVRAESLRLKSALLVEISVIIRRRELSRSSAAKLFGVSVADIRAIESGELNHFSIDDIVGMLSRAGIGLEVELVERKRAA
jgi:predicted XRE-type DNA-binding protein